MKAFKKIRTISVLLITTSIPLNIGLVYTQDIEPKTETCSWAGAQVSSEKQKMPIQWQVRHTHEVFTSQFSVSLGGQVNDAYGKATIKGKCFAEEEAFCTFRKTYFKGDYKDREFSYDGSIIWSVPYKTMKGITSGSWVEIKNRKRVKNGEAGTFTITDISCRR